MRIEPEPLIETALAIEPPEATVTSPLMVVEPEPVTAEDRVPPVRLRVPEVTDKPLAIPEALELKVPAARLIAWDIIFPSVKETVPVELILVVPAPVIFEFMLPPVTSRPLATVLVIPLEVVIPLVAVNLPPEMLIVF